MSRKPLPDQGELSLKVYQFLDHRPSTSAELVAALGISPPERVSSILRILAAKGFIDVVAVVGKGKASQRVWGANRGHDAEICAPKQAVEHKRLSSSEFKQLKRDVLDILHSAPESTLNAGDLQKILAEKENQHSRYNIASALVWLFRAGCTEKIPPSKGRYASYKSTTQRQTEYRYGVGLKNSPS